MSVTDRGTEEQL